MLSKKLKQTAEVWRDMLQNFDWEETREGVSRESQARIVVLGLSGAGKSTLFNQFCGWQVSMTGADPPLAASGAAPVEDFGLFCLVDLSPEPDRSSDLNLYGTLPAHWSPDTPGAANGAGPTGWEWDEPLSLNALSPLEVAETADLLVYVVDGGVGVQAADYRWVGRLRRLGMPLLVVLNKSDLLAEADLAARRAEMQTRLAASVLPVSAQTGAGVKDELLPKMIAMCAKLTVALGRELGDFRQQAATRIIHRAALLNGVVALEPVPLIDLPVQVLTLTGMMLRLGATYDRPPTDVRRREVVVAIGMGLLGRFTAQQIAKLIPMVGWLVSGAIGWVATQAVGRAAMAYFEAGGDGAVDQGWRNVQSTAGRLCCWLRGRWPRRRPAAPRPVEQERRQ